MCRRFDRGKVFFFFFFSEVFSRVILVVFLGAVSIVFVGFFLRFF